MSHKAKSTLATLRNVLKTGREESIPYPPNPEMAPPPQ